MYDGATSHQLGQTFRVRALSSPFWTVEVYQEGHWTALYHFTLEPQQPVDFVVAHHFPATHPRSMLRRTPLLQLTTPETRLHLRGLDLLEIRAGVQHTRRLTRMSLEADLACFGIRLPPDRLSDLERAPLSPSAGGKRDAVTRPYIRSAGASADQDRLGTVSRLPAVSHGGPDIREVERLGIGDLDRPVGQLGGGLRHHAADLSGSEP